MDTTPAYDPDVPGAVGVKTRHEEVPLLNVPAPDAHAPPGTQSPKTAPTAVAPARFPHAEVYTRGASLNSPPHVISKSLGALLGPLAGGDDWTADLVLALLIAYLARTSGESIVAIGYASETVGKIVPFTVAVDGAAPFASLVERVSAERREVEARHALVPAAASAGDDDASWRESWMQPPVIVAQGAEHTEAVAATSQLGIFIDQRSHLTRWCSPAHFDRRFIDSVIEHTSVLARSIAAAPRHALASHDYMPRKERQKIVVQWNDTGREYPYEGGLVARFNAQVARAPTHPAVIFAGTSVTYGELDVRINRLARHLRRQGVGSGTFVGICMERSVEMAIAIYAILKAGGAYVPLSPEDPPARLGAIIGNAGLRLIITQESLAASLSMPDVHPIVLTADPSRDQDVGAGASLGDVAIAPAPDDLAYMIYTSGSTGDPKGVLIQHKAIFNRIIWMQETYRLSPEDRVLQKTPYTFDVSVWEFLWPLTVGATLVVAEPGGHVVPSYLSRLIRQERVTCCHFVPSVLKLFLACPRIETLPLRLVFCSGEALPFDVQCMFMSRSNAQLHNLYGPTEAAVDVSWWHCQPHIHEGRVPIGKPIANIRLYILDEDLRPVGVGVPGELHIAGIGLAKGYWQKSQLTEERFLPDPLACIAGERMYKTGDIVRFLPDGNIEYLGRNDDQVKINGVRMELGEIESAIRGHPAITDVVVVAKQGEQGTVQLAAYLVPEEKNVCETVLGSIKAHIARRLPQSMIPRQFLFVETIPLTRNGKADRKALIRMDSERMEARA